MTPRPPQRPPALSSGQMEVMNVVWERGEATVGEVWQELEATRDISRNTVQTTMVRLEEKGWLTHRTVGQTFMYRAVHERSAALGQMASELVAGAFGGSASGLVQALLDEGVSGPELRRIEGLLAAARSKKRSR